MRKLISVLESIEKLPVLLYDSGAGYGLQILTRRLRFRLERAAGDSTLIDRTGRGLKMEPLSTVHQLERYLLKMVAKQWYDYERGTFAFVRRLREIAQPLTFRHQHDFDENGIIYWIGTNSRLVYSFSSDLHIFVVVVFVQNEQRMGQSGRVRNCASHFV